MFSQITGNYPRQEAKTIINSISSHPQPNRVFRTDTTTTGDILNQSETLAPDVATTTNGVIQHDTKIKRVPLPPPQM